MTKYMIENKKFTITRDTIEECLQAAEENVVACKKHGLKIGGYVFRLYGGEKRGDLFIHEFGGLFMKGTLKQLRGVLNNVHGLQ